MLKIDTHTHIMPDHLPNWSKEFGYGKFIHLDHHRTGFARMMQGDQFFREIESNCWDPVLRINEYAKYNTQVQVVCTIPVLFSYWAKPEHTLKVSEFLNDHIAMIVEEHPKNYVGLATLPMNDIPMAIAELRAKVSAMLLSLTNNMRLTAVCNGAPTTLVTCVPAAPVAWPAYVAGTPAATSRCTKYLVAKRAGVDVVCP